MDTYFKILNTINFAKKEKFFSFIGMGKSDIYTNVKAEFLLINDHS